MSSPFRVVIVGCGNIGGGFDMDRLRDAWPLSHAGAFTQHKGFKIIACVDQDESRRNAFASRWDIGVQASNVRALCSTLGSADVVSICSPTTLHYDHIIQAIELGPRVIFCEKPLTSDIVSSEIVVEACKNRGITLVVNFSRQWDPSLQEYIQQLETGRWGVIRSVVGYYNKGVLNNGSHMVDALFRLIGDLELVSANCGVLDFFDNDPTIAILLTARGGTVPVFLAPGHARDFAFFELEVVCEKGVIRMLTGGTNWESREPHPNDDYPGYQTLGYADFAPGRYVETMASAINEIYNHLLTGASIRSTGENALKVQILCSFIQQVALTQCGKNYENDKI